MLGIQNARRIKPLTKDNIDEVDRSLGVFQENPDLLEEHRARLNSIPRSTPPALKKTPRFTPVFSVENRRLELQGLYCQSYPCNLFSSDEVDELLRLQNDDGYSRRNCPPNVEYEEVARNNTRQRWKEQGIWNEEWDNVPNGAKMWKHQLPMEPISPSGTLPSGQPMPIGVSTVRLMEVANRESTEERTREASRPFFQFIYQVSLERRLLMEEINDPGVHFPLRSPTASYIPPPIDINTRAYNIVKNRWLENEVWNWKWGVLPSMSWDHEQPLESYIQAKMYDNGLSPVSEPCWMREAASLHTRPHSGHGELWLPPDSNECSPKYSPSPADADDHSQHKPRGCHNTGECEIDPQVQHPQHDGDADSLAHQMEYEPVLQNSWDANEDNGCNALGAPRDPDPVTRHSQDDHSGSDGNCPPASMEPELVNNNPQRGSYGTDVNRPDEEMRSEQVTQHSQDGSDGNCPAVTVEFAPVPQSLRHEIIENFPMEVEKAERLTQKVEQPRSQPKVSSCSRTGGAESNVTKIRKKRNIGRHRQPDPNRMPTRSMKPRLIEGL